MTKRDPEYAERLYTSSLHKAAEEAPHPADRHERWSVWVTLIACAVSAVAVVLGLGSLISWVVA